MYNCVNDTKDDNDYDDDDGDDDDDNSKKQNLNLNAFKDQVLKNTQIKTENY